jgi:hypothetical protein
LRIADRGGQETRVVIGCGDKAGGGVRYHPIGKDGEASFTGGYRSCVTGLLMRSA